MSKLVNIQGRPLEEESAIILDKDGLPIETSDDPPAEAFGMEGGDEEAAKDRALIESLRSDDAGKQMQPAAIAADLIAKARIGNLSRSERMLLKANLIANEMAIQNLNLWCTLHCIMVGADVKAFQVSADKLKKWASIHPSKWPVSAARLASGSLAFEALDEIPDPPAANENP